MIAAAFLWVRLFVLENKEFKASPRYVRLCFKNQNKGWVGVSVV